MWLPLIMPLEAYEELFNTYSMPLPISELAEVPRCAEDLHYMSSEHQPSLQNRGKVNNLVIGDVTLGDREPRSSASDANKSTHENFLREVVKCKDCIKPRCLYSLTSPSRMKPLAVIGEAEPAVHEIRVCRDYAMEKFEEAQESEN